MTRIRGPDEIFGALFETVQRRRIFRDSKVFADAAPAREVRRILDDYQSMGTFTDASLRAFVERNFVLPEREGAEPVSETLPVSRQIEALWDTLSRDPDVPDLSSSLIPLPHPYIVPGGRFREIYYWDSYFTMFGLARAGRIDMIRALVANFAYLIDRIGFIPNGNRTYFCTRSQPPVFALMLELLADVTSDDGVMLYYLPQLKREYEFWMLGADSLTGDGDAVRHVVRVGDALLNRYWDESDKPRPESFLEDERLAQSSERDPGCLYRDIRAACESGWDFSSRWLADPRSLASARTTAILPIDLNTLLLRTETALARLATESGDSQAAQTYRERASARQRLLSELFFDRDEGFFVDIALPERRSTGVLSLAAAWPLYLNIASEGQARAVAGTIHSRFLAPGGWRTTLIASGQQWDRPNGWAPLQWLTFVGLRNYGYFAEADEGARRWLRTNLQVFETSGQLLEKYDVENPGQAGGGGEYGVQTGFGWTNAVLLEFLAHFDGSTPQS